MIDSFWPSIFLNLPGRLFRLFRDSVRGGVALIFGTGVSDAEFQKALSAEYEGVQGFLEHFKSQMVKSFFVEIGVKDDLIVNLHQTFPQSEKLIVDAANTICEHNFDLLGSGPVNLGEQINWHQDFKSGFCWDPKQYYARIRPAPYPGGYDLKVPWELSVVSILYGWGRLIG